MGMSEAVGWIFWGLRSVFFVFPVEVALTLGLVFFGLSWIRPRRIVSLPESGGRRDLLSWLGIGGALLVVAVATVSSSLTYLYTFPDPSGFGGWLRRPAPLIATALVVAVFLVALRRQPLPAPGERGIAPRRRWWAFASQPLLWITTGIPALLFITVLWQGTIGTRPPTGADLYGNVPEHTDLPVFVPLQWNMGYYAGAGWPNHLATLAALLLAAALLIIALGHDANRPVFARATAADVRAERAVTARVLVLIVLGGVLLTLGAVWAHVGFIGEIAVGIPDPPEKEGAITGPVVGTSYQAIAGLMHLGGYVIQGIGAALLLRLSVDTWRAARAQRALKKPDGPDPDRVLTAAEATGSAETPR